MFASRWLMPRLSYGRVERTIALTRVILALVSLLSAWLDPDEVPSRTGAAAYLYVGYVVYSFGLVALVWSRVQVRWLPLATLIADLLVLSAFQFLMIGSPNPIFMYFVFILFCAALRWGWSGALRTIPVGAGLLLIVDSSTNRSMNLVEFEFDHLLVRMGYLAMIGALLVFLDWYEAMRRQEIQQLARWPVIEGANDEETVLVFLEYGARLVGADAALLAWTLADEPNTSVACWTPSMFGVNTHAPGDFDPLVPESLEPHTFVCLSSLADAAPVSVQRGPRIEMWRGTPLHPRIAQILGGAPAGSAPFATERLSGRIFFKWPASCSIEVLPLLEAVARQVGASLDQMHARRLQRRLAIGEERVRLARDLHDGVLQSLTSVRFELQRLGRRATAGLPIETRERLLAMERALADEQRAMRWFIEDLKPFSGSARVGSLPRRLEDMGERLSAQWQVPVQMRVEVPTEAWPDLVDHAIESMVQEAVVNALKHGHPSRVRVSVQESKTGIDLVVADDGRGFEFEGEFSHEELAARHIGPASLRDRLGSLGGRLSIRTSPSGARVEMALPHKPTWSEA